MTTYSINRKGCLIPLVVISLAFGVCVLYTGSTYQETTHSRLPRSAHNSQSKDEEVIFVKVYVGDGSEKIYEWVAWGVPWTLTLWQDTHFVAPSFLVTEQFLNETKVTRQLPQCFWRGILDGIPNSDAAINSCHGLKGVIRKEGLLYFIEPLEPQSHHWAADVGQDTKTGVAAHILRPITYPSAGATDKTNVLKRHSQVAAGSDYVLPTQESVEQMDSVSRPRRFIYSQRRTIEVMVVVDEKMAQYHGSNIEEYVLTLMSVVSLIFRDGSIGNFMDIAVVEVVKPDGKAFTPRKSYNNNASGQSAEEMLKTFCKWQRHNTKYNEDHPRRYDTALLITRENICRNPYTQSCDTLGLAELGTMCSRYASCAIVQDNGLSASFTIAHELGHLLNMPHDNDDKCSLFLGKSSESAQHMNVMSRMLDHNTLPWIWSNCSRHFLNQYIQGGHADCLEDEPWNNELLESAVDYTLAGEKFSATKQCKYVFGKSSSICPYMPKCKRLWCTTTRDEKEGCRTQHMPWADGTPCDRKSWCLRGECVLRNKRELKKVHGEWGAWQEWTSCSRSCGVGVKRSERFCDSPKPQYGGLYCEGERVRYESCKLKDCPVGALDFRSQQCKAFNGKSFGLPDLSEHVQWVPKYAGISREDSCKLFCQVHNSSFYYQLLDKVEDGTPCGPDSYDICVNGECRIAGCDYVLNSTLRDDWCGVCNGDNSTCLLTAGSITDKQDWGYSDVVVIPKGAARIQIFQSSYHDSPADDNYLALVDWETGEYVLNGHWIVTPFEKMVEFGGTLLKYSGSNRAVEIVNSTKPLKKKLLVQVLSVGELKPPFIEYSFSTSNAHYEPQYTWKLGSWTECSRSCLGTRQRSAYCMRTDTNARVADHHCENSQRPKQSKESCSVSCPVIWKYTDWSACRLDAENQCTQTREVEACVTSAGDVVGRGKCLKDIPKIKMKCKSEECPSWQYSGWTPCSCSDESYIGKKKRLYACFLLERPVTPWTCNSLPRLDEQKECPCWHSAPWDSVCYQQETETVLELKRKIEEYFAVPKGGPNLTVAQNFDSRAFRGQIIKATHLDHFEEPHQCPKGKKRRTVTCGPPRSPKPVHLCDAALKPAEVSTCELPCASTTNPTTTTPQTISPTPNRWKSPKSPDFNVSRQPKVRKSDVTGRKSKGGSTKGGRINKHIEQSNYIPYDEPLNPISNDINSIFNTKNQPNNNIYIHGDDEGILANNIISIDSDEEQTNNLVRATDNNSGVSHKSVTRQHMWQTGAWTQCSKECGGGEKRRQVVCSGAVSQCPEDLKPFTVSPCNSHLCTEWKHDDWSPCRAVKKKRCRGRMFRNVVCHDVNGLEVSPSQCLREDRPQSEAICRMPCKRNKRLRHRYKWKKGAWSACSEPCGGGVKLRTVACIDKLAGRVRVADQYCLEQEVRTPRLERKCNLQLCPFRYVAGVWSQCSLRCGPGIQTRVVKCHRVSPLGWVDPTPVADKCRRNEPSSKRICNLGPCSTGFFWAARPWKQCQAACGTKGRQRRSVVCLDFKGKRVGRRNCSKKHRPRRKQRCRASPCGFKSCREVRSGLSVHLDNEYSLLVAGQNMSIYCHLMNSSNPREFLTLPAGGEGNYAEIYDKRLLRPDTCPYNGARMENCHCASDDSGRAGLTVFSKIRVNITSLSVDTFDHTFAHAISGRFIPYGEAGDCYSMTQCPQGSFSINLAGTQLKVSDRTSWKGYGNKAAHWISRLDESQRILGRCGGYCGTCTPDPELGLKLDIRLTKNRSMRNP